MADEREPKDDETTPNSASDNPAHPLGIFPAQKTAPPNPVHVPRASLPTCLLSEILEMFCISTMHKPRGATEPGDVTRAMEELNSPFPSFHGKEPHMTSGFCAEH